MFIANQQQIEKSLKGSHVSHYWTKLGRQCFLESNHDYKNTVLLAGSGRGGTTWISQIINYRNDYRLMFEPFNPAKVPVCQQFLPRQYLRPTNKNGEFLAPAKKILSGNIKSHWVDRYNRKFFPRKRLIKDIRINLFLEWINVNFPQIPIIFLLRHPCAVALSKLKCGWQSNLGTILAQDQFVEDYLMPVKKDLERYVNGLESLFHKHILVWCLENVVPLSRLKDPTTHVVFYEQFCESPKLEIERMFHFLRLPYEEGVERAIQQPSSMSGQWSAINSNSGLIDNWKNELRKDDISRAMDILKIFGLDKIYSEHLMPNNNVNLPMTI